jgi:hypothetical protein
MGFNSGLKGINLSSVGEETYEVLLSNFRLECTRPLLPRLVARGPIVASKISVDPQILADINIDVRLIGILN